MAGFSLPANLLMNLEIPLIKRSQVAELANNCGTDKCACHGYHRFYPLVLAQLNHSDPFTIVEIGYGEGASIPFWKSIFPQAYLICVDRDISEEGDGYMVIQADQEHPDQLQDALQCATSPVRLIIDDGSHLPRHQLSSFSFLFETILEPGGFYIIEDIETSYWLAGNLYGYSIRAGIFSRWSAVEALKLAVDYTNRSFLDEGDRNLVEYSMLIAGLDPAAALQIGTITFGQNCALIGKNLEGDSDYQEQAYPFSQFTSRDQVSG
jgi:hypothetical protein